jgi:hypothetical protein
MQRLVARHVISVFSDVRTLHFAELLQLGHAGVPGLISPPSVLLLDTAAASVQESLTNVPYLLVQGGSYPFIHQAGLPKRP